MSDDPDGPSRPRGPEEEEPEPRREPTAERPAGSSPDAVVAQANAFTRRTLVGVLAALFLLGSCGIAYGVFRLAGAGDGGGLTGPPSPGPGSPSPSATTGPTGPTGPALADLVIPSVTATGVVVQNVGTEAAGRFVVSVEGRAFILAEGLVPGESASFDYPCREGPLTAVADSTERIEEADETNNALTAGPFDCRSPSTTTSTTTTATTSTTPSPTGTTDLPDLVVRSVAKDSVTVANVGGAAAGIFVVDVGKAGSFTVRGLAARTSRTIAFGCTDGSLIATADSTNRVEESNENNNSKGGGPFECLPDLVVASIQADNVTIANIGDGDAGPSRVSINGQVLGVPAIPAGQQVRIDYQCIGGVIDVVADAFDDVVESNESNNSASADVGSCP